jgi:hypothetical protein
LVYFLLIFLLDVSEKLQGWEQNALFAPPGGAHTFDLEDRGGMYLENFDEFLQVYTASHSSTLQSFI